MPEIRMTFQRKLREIQDEVLVLGSMVEKAIFLSVEALKNRDLELAKQVIADDAKINEKRFAIEEKCIQLIATQQPLASDLRIVIYGLYISSELERIGDYAEGIAKVVLLIGDEPPLKPLIDIPLMAGKTVDMLHRAIEASVKQNVEAACQIVPEDDVIDSLYDQVFRELLTYMIQDPRTITRAERLIWAAHNLERAADRVTNICELVVYAVTGKLGEIGASKY